jgi:hypothetical protein
MTISRWFLLRMRNFSNKRSRKKHAFYVQWLFSENHAVYGIMSTNMVQPERTQTIWRPRLAYWISKPTRAQAHARARAPTPNHTHGRTRARTHTLIICNTAFHGNNRFVNAPPCYVIRTWPVLLNIQDKGLMLHRVRCVTVTQYGAQV